ncbi:unnamed protein product [Cercospora beticola]|nr:unnamed protein product [Cercospora beticola]
MAARGVLAECLCQDCICRAWVRTHSLHIASDAEGAGKSLSATASLQAAWWRRKSHERVTSLAETALSLQYQDRLRSLMGQHSVFKTFSVNVFRELNDELKDLGSVWLVVWRLPIPEHWKHAVKTPERLRAQFGTEKLHIILTSLVLKNKLTFHLGSLGGVVSSSYKYIGCWQKLDRPVVDGLIVQPIARFLERTARLLERLGLFFQPMFAARSPRKVVAKFSNKVILHSSEAFLGYLQLHSEYFQQSLEILLHLSRDTAIFLSVPDIL